MEKKEINIYRVSIIAFIVGFGVLPLFEWVGWVGRLALHWILIMPLVLPTIFCCFLTDYDDSEACIMVPFFTYYAGFMNYSLGWGFWVLVLAFDILIIGVPWLFFFRDEKPMVVKAIMLLIRPVPEDRDYQPPSH